MLGTIPVKLQSPQTTSVETSLLQTTQYCLFNVSSNHCLHAWYWFVVMMIVLFLVPRLESVQLTHSSLHPDLMTEGECVTFTCTVVLGPGLVESDLSLIEVVTQLYRDGTPLPLSGPPLVTETTLTYSTQLDLSVRNITENYTCMATVRPRDRSVYIRTSTNVSNTLIITSNGKINDIQ